MTAIANPDRVPITEAFLNSARLRFCQLAQYHKPLETFSMVNQNDWVVELSSISRGRSIGAVCCLAQMYRVELMDRGGLKSIRTKSQFIADRCIFFQPVSSPLSKAFHECVVGLRRAQLQLRIESRVTESKNRITIRQRRVDCVKIPKDPVR